MHSARFFPALGLASVFLLPTPVARAGDPPTARQENFRKVEAASRFASELASVQTALDAGKNEEALAFADAALFLQPGDPVALNARGAALVQLGRYDEAAAEFRRVLAANANFFQSDYNLVEILFLQKKYPDAAYEYRVLANKYGDTTLLRFKLFLAYLLGGESDRAATTLATIRHTIDGPAWFYAQAASLLASGDTIRARRLLETADTLHSRDGVLYKNSLRDAGILE